VDPFLGTGTTMAAAMASGRNCLGFEINHGFQDQLLSIDGPIIATANNRINQRLSSHIDHVDRRLKENYQFKYVNKHYDFAVTTRQEVDLFFNPLVKVERIDEGTVQVSYTNAPNHDLKDD
jgi:predicted nucleotide-binding protein (sugar kinase/HSP70/actin superfamily)